MENELSARIEAYFTALEAPLQELPAVRRDEFLAEARAHLNAMVEAKRADGLDEEAAWQSAMSEFGEPREVGRALWKGWANSGQLESEGEPLSARDVVRKFGWRLAVGLSFYCALMLISPEPWWRTPFSVVFGTLCFGFGIYRSRRQGMQWTPSNIAATVFGVVQLLLILAQLQWAQVRLSTWGTFGMLGCWVFWWWLYKRDLTKRPWQAAPNYKQNSIAAEQEYRISPLFGWIAGSAMGCAGMLIIGAQFFSLTQRLLICVFDLVFSLVGGFWLYRRK